MLPSVKDCTHRRCDTFWPQFRRFTADDLLLHVELARELAGDGNEKYIAALPEYEALLTIPLPEACEVLMRIARRDNLSDCEFYLDMHGRGVLRFQTCCK
jgi:hypothetical protein